MSTRIRIPNGWTPRGYQLPLWSYLERGGKRAIEIAHRRWGKDDVALHWTCVAGHHRPATYWHMLPQASQARNAIWEAVNPHNGMRRIDEAFPPALRKNITLRYYESGHMIYIAPEAMGRMKKELDQVYREATSGG